MITLANEQDRASLLDRDRRFFDALVAGDVGGLQAMLADDFILVSISDGAKVTRSELLEALSSGILVFPAIQSFPDEALVRRVGDVGIVVGRTEINFTAEEATTFASSSRYTHVFASDPRAGWLLLSAQGTEIRRAAD